MNGLACAAAVLLPAGPIGSLGRTALGLCVLYYPVASLKQFYGDGWMRTLFNVFLLIILNAVVVTPILFATVALRIM